MVKASPSRAGGVGLIPGRGTKIPHALCSKGQDMKQKQCCGKFNKVLKKKVHIKKKKSLETERIPSSTHIRWLSSSSETSRGWTAAHRGPSSDPCAWCQKAFPDLASSCSLLLSREQHQTRVKLHLPNFGKTCLKLPPTCDGTSSPAGTSWRRPAFTGWALGTNHLSIPLTVLTQSPRFRNTGCFLQTLSQEHPYASKEGGRFTPEHHLDSGLQRQLLILLWLASLPTETPSHPTALPLQWPKHPRPSSCVPALPPVGFIFPPTGFILPSLGARSSHSHFEF